MLQTLPQSPIADLKMQRQVKRVKQEDQSLSIALFGDPEPRLVTFSARRIAQFWNLYRQMPCRRGHVVVVLAETHLSGLIELKCTEQVDLGL